MKRHQYLYTILFSISFIVGLSGCKTGKDKEASTASTASTGLIRNFKVNNIASFDNPWAMVELPDQRLLITEKDGKLQLFNPRDNKKRPVLGVPKVKNEGQGGLGDIQLHPNFIQNQWVYLSYAESDPEFPHLLGAVVIRAKLDLLNNNPRLVDIQGFVGLFVTESHGRLACQVIDMGRLYFLDNFINFFVVEKVSGQILYTFHLLPRLGLFITKTKKVVVCSTQVRENVKS